MTGDILGYNNRMRDQTGTSMFVMLILVASALVFVFALAGMS